MSSSALNKLRTATDGTVNSIDLMTQANNMMILGITKSEDEMADLFDTAQRLGEAMGVDAAQAVEKLTVGLGRQSILRLDDLGITLSQEEANQRYAASIGSTASALTNEQKKIAFTTEAMRKAKLTLEEIGGEQDSFARKVQKFTADVGNMGVVIGSYLIPVIETAIDSMYDIGKAFNQLKMEAAKVDWLQTLENLVNNMPAFGETMGLIWADMIDFMIDVVPPLAKAFFDLISDIAKDMINFVKNVGSFFGDPFIYAMVAIALETKLIFQEVWGTIKSGASDAINFMIEKANYLLPKAMEIEWRASAPDLSGIEETKASLEAIAVDIANLDFTKWLRGVSDDDVKTVEDLLTKLNQHYSSFVDGIIVLKDDSKTENGNNPIDEIIAGKGGGDPEKTRELTNFEQFALDAKLVNYQTFVDQMGTINSAYQGMVASNQEAEMNALMTSKEYMNASTTEQEKMVDKLEDEHFQSAKKQFHITRMLRLAEIYMATAQGVAQAMTMQIGVPPGPNYALAGIYKASGLVQAAIVMAQKQPVKAAQYGFSGIVDQPTTFLAGEAGAEMVNVTPLEGPNLEGGSAGGVTVNISGNVLSTDWVENELSERISEAVRRGVSFGI